MTAKRSKKLGGSASASGATALRKRSNGDLTQNAEPRKPPGFTVVGIGASAGGLDAFKRFMNAMPPDSGMGFVLIQHLDPKHESLTAELLSKQTSMKVVQAQDRMPILPNHVYVIPPNKDLNVRSRVLYLSELSERRGVRIPIDFFFRSLAEDQQENAVGIVLSGTGSDGTLGLKAIKGYGGVTLAQTPETAQFDGMPRSAIIAGVADHVVPVEQMPEFLLKYVKARKPVGPVTDHLPAILAVVQARTKYDFRFYKTGTLQRRIERRMSLNNLPDVGDYLEFLRRTPKEPNLLLKDLLIGVTGFFREPAAFETLEKEVIAPLVRAKEADAGIRVWVPGCSTGEEPYSLAMLLLEQHAAAQKPCHMQIFASDLDQEALAKARIGLYLENVAADVSPERLRQHFKREGNAYQVSKQLRDSVVFAAQNLVSDPPFSRLDLVSCRNLLIYLEPTLQRKVLSLFHFVLKEGGHLFLGNSETVGQLDDLFEPVSKKWRIYRRVGGTRRDRFEFPVMRGTGFQPAALSAASSALALETGNVGKIAQQLLLEQYVPFTVLINRKFEVLFLSGASGKYLELPAGSPTRDLLFMARETLRPAIRTAVDQALKQAQPATSRARFRNEPEPHLVKVTARPVQAPKPAEGLLLVSFEDEPVVAPAAGAGAGVTATEPGRANDELVLALENELKSTKEGLESSVRDLEVANEELKTSNEEIMSMNEELQSANEELETSKEELQSVNEELTTLNSQLQDKLDELAISNDDLANLLSSTDIATIFVDRQFRIKRFTPPARKQFKLIHADIGRPLSDIAGNVLDSSLQKDAERVLDKLVPMHKEVQTDDGCWYIQQVVPYQTQNNKIEGVVITFTDITVSKKGAQTVSDLKDWLQLLLSSATEAIYGVDFEGRTTYANRAFLALTGYSPEDVIGKNAHSLIHHTSTDGSQFAWKDSAVYRGIHEGATSTDSRAVCWRKDGTSFQAGFSAGPIVEGGRITGVVTVIRDVSQAEGISKQMDFLANHDSLTGLLNRRAFEQRLDRVIESARVANECHALCYLDLNEFKRVNDQCGHEAGDDALQKLAGMLRGKARKRDTVARLGGDEFAVLLEHCDLDQARRTVEEMRAAIAGFEYEWKGNKFRLGVSIGLVPVTATTASRLDLLRLADAACYADKNGART